MDHLGFYWYQLSHSRYCHLAIMPTNMEERKQSKILSSHPACHKMRFTTEISKPFPISYYRDAVKFGL